ncbi:bifunctional 2-polyprenyl-6-hydroxyphenol methylase/3-demethylubiquinol 3-O-methyltransferase UbiG [Arthrobacter sp. V1I7]|uniref:class I SAM-dependent methyltransferase n=1 Tax=Arthrobacter sp. V1I7 TaxID=3042274 RepID=UPI0027D85DE6|nr:class I SAM-dependent methyltransferase [Arthrobacter sp. V1I7]
MHVTEKYVSKMRNLAVSDVDLEVDARFVDMLIPRGARVLDLGCGIGSAVKALRQRGHEAYGIDPSEPALQVAADLFDASWYRQLRAEDASRSSLEELGLPLSYECVLMAGNVPAFLTSTELQAAFHNTASILTPAGLLVTGTSTNSRGGPRDQDEAADASGLALHSRYSNWHVSPFTDDPWCVSIYKAPGIPATSEGPDGMFILRSWNP